MSTRGAPQEQRQSNPSVSSVTAEPLESRRLLSGAPVGINVNDFGRNSYKDVVQMLRDSGTKAVRLWYGFDSYGQRSTYENAEWARRFHEDGFNVTLTVSPRKGRVGTYDETRAYFDYLVTVPNLVDSVDMWEIGNEVDAAKYWKGSFSEYVNQFLAPASKVLHGLGEKVISGSVSWNPEDIKSLVDAGMLKYADYVGYHPYRNSTGQLKAAIAEVKSYVGGTPLVATEWNVRGHGTADKDAWAAEIKDFWTVIRQNFAAAHYFAAVTQDSMAGPSGVLTASGKHNNPFYGTYLSLQDDGKTPPADTGSNDNGNSDTGNSDDGKGDGKDNGSDTDGDNSSGSGGGQTSTGSDGETDDSDGATTGGTKSTGGTKTNSGTKNNGGTKTSTGTKGSSGTKTGSGTKTPTKTGSGSSTGTGSTPVVETPPPAPVVPPELTSLSLINANRDRLIKPYAVLSGTVTLDLATLGTAFLSVLASGNSKVGSVMFTLNGETIVDSKAGFTLFGEEANGNILGGNFAPNRSYVLTAQAFSGANATGTSSAVSSVVINVIDSGNSADRTAAAATLVAEQRRKQALARRNRLNPVTTLPGV